MRTIYMLLWVETVGAVAGEVEVKGIEVEEAQRCGPRANMATSLPSARPKEGCQCGNPTTRREEEKRRFGGLRGRQGFFFVFFASTVRKKTNKKTWSKRVGKRH